ncbi:MAG TPA: hypothetical protein PKK33_09810 [Candidatus Cloacimonadota bacterium]|nr:hypothetical protein [Candidatus Cloacimonadota bacterium]
MIHRTKDNEGNRVENLISIIPNESFLGMVHRIRPKAGEEIVVLVTDNSIQANIQAEKSIESLKNFEDAVAASNEPESTDDLPF